MGLYSLYYLLIPCTYSSYNKMHYKTHKNNGSTYNRIIAVKLKKEEATIKLEHDESQIMHIFRLFIFSLNIYFMKI